MAAIWTDAPDPDSTNNQAQASSGTWTQSTGNLVYWLSNLTSDLAWSAAAHRLFASVPNGQVNLGSTLLALDPATGAFDAPIPTGTEPNRLAVSANGQYVYAGLDADSSIQRVDVSNHLADLKFPTGFGNVADMAVLPDNPHAVVATVHTTLVVYDDGVQRFNYVSPTEYNHPYFFALSSPTTCYLTYPTGFRRIAINANGATLLSDTRNTVVTYSDWEFDHHQCVRLAHAAPPLGCRRSGFPHHRRPDLPRPHPPGR